MRLALVALPWASFNAPSAAIGLLAAVVRRAEPAWTVDAVHTYLDFFDVVGSAYEAISEVPELGELTFVPALYPERREATIAALGADVPAHVVVAAIAHADRVAADLAGRYDVVGFTTTYAQLFASLAVARRLRAHDPHVRIVLGGGSVGWHLGAAILREYPFVDFVVQGEGEDRLLALLRQLSAGAPVEMDGVLVQGEAPSVAPRGRVTILDSEVADLDALPDPDYDDYAARADALAVRWTVPMEGSRGCWWDRVKRSGDPMQSCYFCALNTSSYRHKSAERVGAEMNRLAARYRNTRFKFLDNILRARGVEALTDAMQAEGRAFGFFYEMRAQVGPAELLALRDAGLEQVQFGIEGLAAGYLKRIGKGTTPIQNLQAMRAAQELGLVSTSNLLTGFPGATAAEVAETVDVIDRFAIAYAPAFVSRFQLGIESAAYRVPERFGVTGIRSRARFGEALPPDVFARLPLFFLDFDGPPDPVDWSPVEAAVARWQARHAELAREHATVWPYGVKPLHYHDGGTFLEIVDRRHGYEVTTLEDEWRDVYLACAEVASRPRLHARFAEVLDPEGVDEILEHLTGQDLLFREGERFLALAVAWRGEVAARRIRAATRSTPTERITAASPG